MSSGPILNIDHIDVFYGDFHALWDVSLTISKSDIVSIIGANGAGKSTTLMSISGIVPPRSGEVLFMGQAIQDRNVIFSPMNEALKLFPDLVQQYFKEYDVWIVGTAGFTPIPYKLFTITAGFVKSNFITFMVVSLVARSARFFLVAGLIWKFGPQIKKFIDKYFNILSIGFMVLLIGGFVLMKLVL